MPDPVTLYIILILFLAVLVRSAFGFGQGLVAIPLLVLKIPLTHAVPLTLLVAILVAGIILLQDFRHAHFKSAAGLLLASLIGTPIGIYLLTHLNTPFLKSLVALFILTFALYSLLAKNKLHLQKDHHAWLLFCGFLSGLMGGICAMNGPPLVIYGSLRQWAPQHFRATLQAFFFPAAIILFIGCWKSGLWTAQVNHDFLYALPAVLLAIPLGRAINHRLKGQSFFKFLYVALIAIATLLLVQSFNKPSPKKIPKPPSPGIAIPGLTRS